MDSFQPKRKSRLGVEKSFDQATPRRAFRSRLQRSHALIPIDPIPHSIKAVIRRAVRNPFHIPWMPRQRRPRRHQSLTCHGPQQPGRFSITPSRLQHVRTSANPLASLWFIFPARTNGHRAALKSPGVLPRSEPVALNTASSATTLVVPGRRFHLASHSIIPVACSALLRYAPLVQSHWPHAVLVLATT